MVNNHCSYETKLEAIRLLNEEMSGRQSCKKLCLKSDGLIYTWRKWLRDGQYYRLSQPQGLQYKYHKGVAELSNAVRKEQEIRQMKEELEVVKNI